MVDRILNIILYMYRFSIHIYGTPTCDLSNIFFVGIILIESKPATIYKYLLTDLIWYFPYI